MNDLKDRSKKFALAIISLVQDLPSNRIAAVIGTQPLKSGTSVGANYRAACRAKSVADFISKMGIVEEEIDESSYWMELLSESGIVSFSKLESLFKESDELVAMTVSSIKTARKRTRGYMRP